jgi:hypothetical protein
MQLTFIALTKPVLVVYPVIFIYTIPLPHAAADKSHCANWIALLLQRW